MYHHMASGQPQILHVDPKVVNNIIKKLEEKFEQESPLVTSQGKKIVYLGMCIDYTIKGKVKISMYDFIDKMLAELPSDMNGVSATPAALHLFNIDEGAETRQKQGTIVPPSCSKTTVPKLKKQTRYTDCRGVFMHKSTIPRQG